LSTSTPTPTPVSTPLRRIQDLPGPKGWPVVGNLLQVKPDQMHLKMASWAGEFGRLYQVRFGPIHALIVADHELVTTLLRDRPEGFRRNSRIEAVAKEMGLKEGLFGAEGESWKRQRRMVMSAFDPGHVKAYYPSLVRCGDRLRGRWARAAQTGASIDLQADLMRFTVDAIAGLAFGTDVNTLESDEDILQNHLDKIFPKLYSRIVSPVPYWRWFKLESDKTLDRALTEVNTAIDGFIATARAQLAADPERRSAPQNLLEAMLVAAAEPSSGIDDDQIAGNVMTMLLAGEDTTANTLAWCIGLLFDHPTALARAQAEVRDTVPQGAAVTAEHLSELRYIDACMSETMRLRPVAPFIGLQALHDTTVADVTVPRNALVIALMRYDSLDDQFVPQAKQFRPERWLGEDGLSAAGAKRTSMPFGAGPRMCPGRYLALQEMKMVMATLLGNFDLIRVGTESGAEPAERMTFAMEPVGLEMRLRVR
jgi:cytochrome P450